MIITLDLIRTDFPRANYPPDPNCIKCGGTGTTGPRRLIKLGRKPNGQLGSWIEEHPDHKQGCICLYIADQSIRNLVTTNLAKLAREHAATMHQKETQP